MFFFAFPGTDGLLQGNFFDKLNAILLSLLVTQEMHLSNLTSTLQKSSNWINYAFNSNPTFNNSQTSPVAPAVWSLVLKHDLHTQVNLHSPFTSCYFTLSWHFYLTQSRLVSTLDALRDKNDAKSKVVTHLERL